MKRIRLIASDLDGTLLDGRKVLPAGLNDTLARLAERGIAFCPASGRQYQSILDLFPEAVGAQPVIAENGALVMLGGRELASTTIAPAALAGLLARLRSLPAGANERGAVLCGKRSAYALPGRFSDEVRRYYPKLEVVEDFAVVQDEILKLALYDAGSAAREIHPHFAALALELDLQVVVSGEHWVDVMAASVNKGAGLRAVQTALGITRDETMVFGDFFNDVEMFAEALHSYAMANALPAVAAHARHRAPGNDENGVLRVIDGMLEAA